MPGSDRALFYILWKSCDSEGVRKQTRKQANQNQKNKPTIEVISGRTTEGFYDTAVAMPVKFQQE
ncbi:hypothetical protein [Stieleria marina]|uniref:hypothetical protein n=1 Tax=Stieleria marina TaxID=1930275 RepID=UPI003AF3B27F